MHVHHASEVKGVPCRDGVFVNQPNRRANQNARVGVVRQELMERPKQQFL